MHPIAFRKAMIEAYLAGAESIIESGSHEYPSKQEAREWFDNEYGIQDEEECDCYEENDEE
jgi:hypothetical protein